jgi:hypothetical protein
MTYSHLFRGLPSGLPPPKSFLVPSLGFNVIPFLQRG